MELNISQGIVLSSPSSLDIQFGELLCSVKNGSLCTQIDSMDQTKKLCFINLARVPHWILEKVKISERGLTFVEFARSNEVLVVFGGQSLLGFCIWLVVSVEGQSTWGNSTRRVNQSLRITGDWNLAKFEFPPTSRNEGEPFGTRLCRGLWLSCMLSECILGKCGLDLGDFRFKNLSEFRDFISVF